MLVADDLLHLRILHHVLLLLLLNNIKGLSLFGLEVVCLCPSLEMGFHLLAAYFLFDISTHLLVFYRLELPITFLPNIPILLGALLLSIPITIFLYSASLFLGLLDLLPSLLFFCLEKCNPISE